MKILLISNKTSINDRIYNVTKDLAYLYCSKDANQGLYYLTMHLISLIIVSRIDELEYTCRMITSFRKIKNVFILYWDSVDMEGKKQVIEAGADMVIPQCCTDSELKMQIYALIRRLEEWNENVKPTVISEPPLCIDYDFHRVYWNNSIIKLTSREFDLLCLLATTPGRVYTFEQIYQIVCKEYVYGDTANILWCMVSRLKRKLRRYDIRAANIIHNVRGIGYYFELNKM